jgi:hypothetical protein
MTTEINRPPRSNRREPILDIQGQSMGAEPPRKRMVPLLTLLAITLVVAGVAISTDDSTSRTVIYPPQDDPSASDDDDSAAVVTDDDDDDDSSRPRSPVIATTGRWTSTRLKVWGFNDAMRQYNKESIYGRYFYARRDQVLTAARLILELNDEEPLVLNADIKALQVSLNDEVVHTISRKELLEGPREIEINFDSRLLTDENEFVLTFIPYNRGPCQPIVAPGVWAIIKGGQLDTQAEQLPLPNDLGMLPVPFFDQRTDREPFVQIVFLEPLNPINLHASALVASYFGIQTGAGGVRFPTTLGALPEGHAVVLTTNEGIAERVDLPPVTGPTIQMVDHPGIGQQNYKLLLVQGRDDAELKLAAEKLTDIAWGTGPYFGPMVEVDAEFLERQEEEQEGGFPDWFVTERETRFADLMPYEDTLTHRGHAGDTLRFEFRISPQLLAEPAEYLIMDLEYVQRLPSPYTPAKLDVEFNGIFVETLPKYEGGLDAMPHIEQIILPRDNLKGANRLQVHVSALQHEPLCVADSWNLVENTVTGNSTLRLVGETEVANLPNVEAFVYDGLPYTLKPYLSNTAVILPVEPRPAEVGAALSVLSNFAGATGRPGFELIFMPSSVFNEEGQCIDDLVRPGDCERNLIYVDSVEDSDLLRSWADRMPLDVLSGRLRVRNPTGRDTTLELLRAEYPHREARLAAEFLADSELPQAVMSFESPAASGRTTVVVASNTAEELPALIDLQGYTEARREEGGDLLLLDGEKRAIFRLGPDYSETEMHWAWKSWWFVIEHWVLLILACWLAALLMGWWLKSTLTRHEQNRVAAGGTDD